MAVLRMIFMTPLLCLVTCSLLKLRYPLRRSLLLMILYNSALVVYAGIMDAHGRMYSMEYILSVLVSASLFFYSISAYRGFRFVFSMFTELCMAMISILAGGLVAVFVPVHGPAAGALAELLCLLFVAWLIYRFLRAPMLSVMENGSEGFGLLCLIPVLLIMSVLTFLWACGRTSYSENAIILRRGMIIEPQFIPSLLLTVLFIIMVYFALFRYFSYQNQLYEERYNRHALRLRAEALAAQCEVYDTAQEKMRQLRHDMRHHIAVLSAFLDNARTEEAAEYLSGLGRTFDGLRIEKYCLNPVVNSVLSVFAQSAGQEGIALDFYVDFPKEVPIDALDLGVVLSNALENAMNACLRLEPERRKISLNFRYYGNKLIFEIKNPYQGEARFDEKGMPITEEEGHGMGSRAIAAFARKYHSVLYYKAQDGIFTLRLLVDGLEKKEEPEEMAK